MSMRVLSPAMAHSSDPTRVRKLVVVYVFGPANAGDLALNAGAFDLLAATGDFHVTGISRFGRHSPDYEGTRDWLSKYYPQVELRPFPFVYDRHRQGPVRRAMSLAKGGVMLALGVTGGMGPAIGQADFVLFAGGNLLFVRRWSDMVRLYGIPYPLVMALRSNVPIGFLPQSIPDLRFSAGRRRVDRVFRRSRFVYFRESDSLSAVDLTGVPRVRRLLDLAFYIDKMNREQAYGHIQEHQLPVRAFAPLILRVSTLGDQGDLSANEIGDTLNLVQKAAEKISASGLSPCLVVQTRKDLAVTQQCAHRLAEKGIAAPLIEEYDPIVLRALYEQAAFVVAMRLHSGILALSTGTPAVGMYRDIWGRKMPGTFADLGIGELVREFQRHNEVGQLVDRCLNPDERESLRDRISARVADERTEAVKALREDLVSVVCA